MYRLPNSNGTAHILSEDQIPSFNYELADDFVKREKLQDEIDRLKVKRSEIEAMPISNDEKITRLKSGYADLQKKIHDRVARFLNDPTLWHPSVTNPLLNFEIRFYKRMDDNIYIPPLAFFEDAIKQQTDTGISERDREKQLQAINAKIDDLQKQTPITITQGHKDFVKYWQDVQSQLSAPAGPRAISIDASSDAEKRAWKILGLKDYVNSNGLKPNPAD